MTKSTDKTQALSLVKCEHCKKKFAQRSLVQKYCSDRCRFDAWRAREKAKRDNKK